MRLTGWRRLWSVAAVPEEHDRGSRWRGRWWQLNSQVGESPRHYGVNTGGGHCGPGFQTGLEVLKVRLIALKDGRLWVTPPRSCGPGGFLGGGALSIVDACPIGRIALTLPWLWEHILRNIHPSPCQIRQSRSVCLHLTEFTPRVGPAILPLMALCVVLAQHTAQLAGVAHEAQPLGAGKRCGGWVTIVLPMRRPHSRGRG